MQHSRVREDDALVSFIRAMPKVELHLHLEGSLEPEQAFEFARRNGVDLPFASVEEMRRAYAFDNLQSFLDLYNGTMNVLQTAQDFHDLTYAYLQRSVAQGLVHVEPFFDPQGHTSRGVPFEAVISGITRALDEARERLGVSSRLILSFWRHLSEADAFATWEQAQPYLDRISAVGLDSSELGNPPEKFARVFARVREHGLKTVAHAGEEGPPEYIWGALEALNASRIDHGVRCLEDESLVRHLAEKQIPLTVCPLSNVRLRVFPDLPSHNLKALLQRGLCVSLHSDDPAYFGGYVGDNYVAAQQALDLDAAQILTLAGNAIDASFLESAEKANLHDALKQSAERFGFGVHL